MKNAWITLFVLALGCGHYHPYDYDYEYETEVIVTDGPFYEEAITSAMSVQVTWHDDSHDLYEGISHEDVDLDLEMVTPYGELISFFNPYVDTCDHFGDDSGFGGSGGELIECSYPSWGPYDIRVINFTDYDQTATIVVTLTEEDYYGEEVTTLSQTVAVPPWGLEIWPIHVE